MTQPTSAIASSPAAPRSGRRDKRALILDAAIKVFAESGYHGARVSDIAREAGIAYGLVYHYFKNKEEILSTIFEERWSGFLEAVEAIASSPATTEDKLVSVAAMVLNAYRVRPDWVKVLVLEIQRSSRFSEPDQIRAVSALFEVISRIVRSGQERGELRDDLDAALACTVFVGSLDLFITSLVLGVTVIEGDEHAQRAYYLKAARTVVDVFLRGLEIRR